MEGAADPAQERGARLTGSRRGSRRPLLDSRFSVPLPGEEPPQDEGPVLLALETCAYEMGPPSQPWKLTAFRRLLLESRRLRLSRGGFS